jgi:hypothetical protein
MMPSPSAAAALSVLRDGSQFKWYVIPLFAIVVYIYGSEIERRNWNAVFAGLAFWGMDWFNEIWNALFFHYHGYAPVWGTPGHGSAYVILIGLNIEITFMFALSGVAFSKMLLPDPRTKILGIPNRWFVAVAGSAFCVIVEILLNAAGALTWDYAWWNVRAPWLIFLIGYLPFFLVSFWVYDMKTIRQKALTVAVILGLDLAALIVFAGILRWI